MWVTHENKGSAFSIWLRHEEPWRNTSLAWIYGLNREKNGIEICSDVDKHPFHWMETSLVTEWISSFLTLRHTNLTCTPTACRDSSWSGSSRGDTVPLLLRQAALSVKTRVASQQRLMCLYLRHLLGHIGNIWRQWKNWFTTGRR